MAIRRHLEASVRDAGALCLGIVPPADVAFRQRGSLLLPRAGLPVFPSGGYNCFVAGGRLYCVASGPATFDLVWGRGQRYIFCCRTPARWPWPLPASDFLGTADESLHVR